MKEISSVLGWVLLVGALAAFWLYSGSERKSQAAEVVLRGYDVPAGRAEELSRVLSGAMPRDANNQGIARVTSSPDGRVLVVGSRAIQKGVESVLAQATKHPAAPPPTVDMSYWLVTATSAAKSGETTADLKEIETALEAIRKVDGPMQFTLMEKIRLASMSDERGQGRGGYVERFEQRASVSGGKVIADILLDALGVPQIETRVQLAPDQFMVLGESSLSDAKNPGTRLYYIVRPTVRG